MTDETAIEVLRHSRTGTIAGVADQMGVPRLRVYRCFAKLVAAGKIHIVGTIKTGRQGPPTRVYGVSK